VGEYDVAGLCFKDAPALMASDRGVRASGLPVRDAPALPAVQAVKLLTPLALHCPPPDSESARE
jgi:hypothetical protein